MTATHTRGPQIHRTGAARRPTLTLAALATAQLMLVIDVTVVNVALPQISTALGLAPSAVPWVLTAYVLAFGGLMLLGGRLADVVGPRRILVIGLAVFTAASLGCALAGSAATLIAGRVVQGIGAAMISPAALALVTTAFSGGARARALSVWGAVSGGGVAVGVVLGGVLTSSFGWPWIFAINVPVGVLLLVAVPWLAPAAPRHEAGGRPDVAGALLVTLGTGSLIYGLVEAGTQGWSAPSTLLPLAGGVAAWALLVRVERSTPQPLLRIDLFRDRSVLAGAFLMLVATGLMVGGFFLGSFTLQTIHGLSPLEGGLAFLAVAVAVITGSHTAGRVLARVPARAVAAVGLAIAAAGETVVATSDSPTSVVVGLSIAALGIGAAFVTAFTVALSGAEAGSAGLRSAIVNTFHELGGAVGVAALAAVAGGALGSSLAAPALTDAYIVAAATAAVAAVAAAVLVPHVVGSPAGDPHAATPHATTPHTTTPHTTTPHTTTPHTTHIAKESS